MFAVGPQKETGYCVKFPTPVNIPRILTFYDSLADVLCPDRARLLLEYRDKAKSYADAVFQLAETIGSETVIQPEIEQGKCREAWSSCEQSRIALARHEQNHFCDRADIHPSRGVSGLERRNSS